MENLLLSLEVVGPLFLIMAVGYLLRRTPMLDEHAIKNCNQMVFKLFLPALMFRNLVETDFSQAVEPAMLLVCIVGLLLSYGVSFFMIPLFCKDPRRRGVLAQGIARSNTALFGVPVALSIYGEGNYGAVVVMMAFVVPLTNLCSVLVLELSRGGKPQWGHILKSIGTNPIIIVTLLGILLNVSHVAVPDMVLSAVKSLGAVATPLAFVSLGASFSFQGARKNSKALFAATALRLMVLPALFLGAAVLLGVRGQQLCAVLLLSAPPTAVSSFPMAQVMGGDAELADQIVVTTSLCSIITMFLWIYLLKDLALI